MIEREPSDAALRAAVLVMMGATNPSERDIEEWIENCHRYPGELVYGAARKWALALDDFAAQAVKEKE